MKKVVMKAWCGELIDNVCAKAKELAKRDKCMVRFDFNGVTMTATPKKSVSSMLWDFWASGLSRWHVGLSDSEKYEIEQKQKAAALLEKLEKCPPMEFSDKDGWLATVQVNAGEPYGEAVIRYAESWARLMQYEMSLGNSIPDIADRLSHEADVDGISGSMFGLAGGLLSKCWIHGEELRRWHNSQYGVESGGVVNPAVVTIG